MRYPDQRSWPTGPTCLNCLSSGVIRYLLTWLLEELSVYGRGERPRRATRSQWFVRRKLETNEHTARSKEVLHPGSPCRAECGREGA